MTRKLLLLSPLAVLAVVLASGGCNDSSSTGSVTAGGDDRPDIDPPAPTLEILKGPYLQHMTPTAVTVMWETDQHADAAVAFGPAPALDRTVSRSEPRTVHELRLTGLTQGTLYRYVVTSESEVREPATAEGTFLTAPATESGFRMAIYGDSRSNAAGHRAVASAILRGLGNVATQAIVLHTGDFVGNGYDYEAWGTEFFEPAAALLSCTAFFPCLGNHEMDASWYYTFFATPATESGSTTEAWYSFDYGCAHITALDTCQDFSPGSEQSEWLTGDLQSAAAEDAVWRFVFFHHPPFSSGPHGGNQAVQAYLVPLFEANAVDLVFCGHDHLYERSFKNGVYYVTTGGGGAPLYSVNLNETANPYSIYPEAVNHYVLINVSSTTLILQAIDLDGNVIDGFAL